MLINIDKYIDISGYNGDYKITKNGDIYSFKREKIIKLKTSFDKNGYVRVKLCKNGEKSLLVHRLVAETFITDKFNFKSMPYEDKSSIDLKHLEINHKDENKQNNSVENLEWCTHAYNSNYGSRVDRIIPKTISKTRKKVCQYSLDGELIKIWDGVNIASRELNIIQQNITRSCKNEKRTAGGYIWRYLQKGGDIGGKTIINK